MSIPHLLRVCFWSSTGGSTTGVRETRIHCMSKSIAQPDVFCNSWIFTCSEYEFVRIRYPCPNTDTLCYNTDTLYTTR